MICLDCAEQATYVITCFDGSSMELCDNHTMRMNMADKMVGDYPLIESTKPIEKDANK